MTPSPTPFMGLVLCNGVDVRNASGGESAHIQFQFRATIARLYSAGFVLDNWFRQSDGMNGQNDSRPEHDMNLVASDVFSRDECFVGHAHDACALSNGEAPQTVMLADDLAR